MTTTADKIAQIKRALENMQEWLGKIASDIERLEKEHNVKPPDPEPMEFWTSFCRDNPRAATYLHLTKEEADKWPVPTDRDWVRIHVRQVTPQDEQDRKDAARYRYWRAVFLEQHKFLVEHVCGTDGWDRRIDKAMEEK